jgi:hypothetical protein
MIDGHYKKYTNQARRGIKGEAFFEALIVEHAIPHRIARQNDLGIDFLCEWTYGDRPCGILFSAQVKSTTTAEIKPQQVSQSNDKNGLEIYTLTGAPKVDETTINYWKGLGLPAFLFYVVEDEETGHLDCFVKRYTPLLDDHANEDDKTGSKLFYKVNTATRFRGFADTERKILGFARDLIVDYARLWYSKGHIVPLTPTQLGFWPFSDDKKDSDLWLYFPEFVKWNRQKIQETCDWVTNLLKQTPE